MQFFQTRTLLVQICADRFGHARFRCIRRCDPYGSDETAIQIMLHMALVPIHAYAATFTTMTHLPIFDADASIFSDTFDEAGVALRIDLYILLLDLLRNL